MRRSALPRNGPGVTPSRKQHGMVWTLLACALLMRAMVPAGWMPDFERSDALTVKICGSASGMVIRIGDAEPQQDRAHRDKPCTFAGMGKDALLSPAMFADVAAPPPAGQRVATLAPIFLQRLHRERPPGRAPPVA